MPVSQYQDVSGDTIQAVAIRQHALVLTRVQRGGYSFVYPDLNNYCLFGIYNSPFLHNFVGIYLMKGLKT